MRVTTITCDRCKKIVEPKGQLWEVCLDFRIASSKPFDTPYKRVLAEWCRPCMEELGLVATSSSMIESEQPVPATPKPSLETLIREIIQSELKGE